MKKATLSTNVLNAENVLKPKLPMHVILATMIHSTAKIVLQLPKYTLKCTHLVWLLLIMMKKLKGPLQGRR